jgi:hypothetical protein
MLDKRCSLNFILYQLTCIKWMHTLSQMMLITLKKVLILFNNPAVSGFFFVVCSITQHVMNTGKMYNIKLTCKITIQIQDYFLPLCFYHGLGHASS